MLKVSLGVLNLTRGKVPESLFKKAIFETFKILGLKGNIEVRLVLIGEKKMRELNKKYRNKNKATDVLSFSFASPKSAGWQTKAGFYEDRKDERGDISIGEIIICLPYAKRQAEEEKNSLRKELALLASHGAIHLFGIDHERSKEEDEKTNLIQNKVVNKIF